MINQLFKVKPSTELLYRCAHTFGLTGMNDKRKFSFREMAQNGTVSRMNTQLRPDLESVYMDCKKSYLADLTERSALTVFRQLARTHGYRIERTDGSLYQLIKT